MKLLHFDALGPICPACQIETGAEHRLILTVEAKRSDHDILEGVLQCPSTTCKREYPILDGVPLLVPDPRSFIATQLQHLTNRDDLSGLIEGFLVEGSGPGSAHDSGLTQLSSYTWDHYAEWDPETAHEVEAGAAQPGSVIRALDIGLELARASGVSVPTGPVLDLGCAVGRGTFELARRAGSGLVLGADLGAHFLRLASRVLRRGSVRYPRRRLGVLYDWREFAVPVDGERVDFWAADGARLPFANGTFGQAVALNLLDCLYSPLDLLRSVARVLKPGAAVVLAAPYDWTPAATAIEGWIGGHSPRSLGSGRSDAVLRALLTPGGHPASVEGLELVAERDDVPWTVRLHERSVVTYRLHMVVAVRR